MGLDHAARVVAAIVAATDDALIPLDLLPERVFAAGENQAHDDGGVQEDAIEESKRESVAGRWLYRSTRVV